MVFPQNFIKEKDWKAHEALEAAGKDYLNLMYDNGMRVKMASDMIARV